MPTYNFICRKCENIFTDMMPYDTLKEKEAADDCPVCPKCGEKTDHTYQSIPGQVMMLKGLSTPGSSISAGISKLRGRYPKGR